MSKDYREILGNPPAEERELTPNEAAEIAWQKAGAAVEPFTPPSLTAHSGQLVKTAIDSTVATLALLDKATPATQQSAAAAIAVGTHLRAALAQLGSAIALLNVPGIFPDA